MFSSAGVFLKVLLVCVGLFQVQGKFYELLTNCVHPEIILKMIAHVKLLSRNYFEDDNGLRGCFESCLKN